MQRRELIKAATCCCPSSPGRPRPGPQAGDYPKAGATLRYVVPFPPGGLTDVMARLVGQQLGKRWGVNVVIDNKPGGGGADRRGRGGQGRRRRPDAAGHHAGPRGQT